MQRSFPRVSIGVPVRDGQRFLSAALDSLLAQTFDDFEVIVCDNASTDRTEQVCREYVARDPRIRYHRNPRDIGPAANFNLSFELSQGAYFRWNAYDDVAAPEYLARCVEVLDRDSSIVLAYPSTTVVDEHGHSIATYDFRPATDSHDACRRFAELVLVNHRLHRAVEIFGLMRASALRKTPLQGAYARGDSVLLARMALLGRFVELPERLFFSRSHASQSMQTLPGAMAHGGRRWSRWLGTGPLPPPEWWDCSLRGKITFPEWKLFSEYWISVTRSTLGPLQRARCYGTLMRWLLTNAPKLARDAAFAAEQLLLPIARDHQPRSPGTPQTT